MTRLRDSGSTHIWMERNTKETGKTINRVDKEKKVGLMVLYMKETMKMVKSMDLEYSNGLMVQNTKETF